MVFGPRGRQRIAFLAKFGEAGFGRKKAGLERSRTKHFLKKVQKWTGRMRVWNARQRIAFLAENGQAWLWRVKQGLGAANQCIFEEKGSKNTPKWDGWKRVWTAQARADRVFREIRRSQAWALKERARAQ